MTMCQVNIFIVMNIKKIIKEDMGDFDWASDVGEYEPKVGDTVRCKEGYSTNPKSKIYGGRGYKPNREFIIHRITEATNFDSRVILWPDDGGHGVYLHTVEVIDLNMTESDDFDWASDVEPFKPFDVTSNYMVTGVPSRDIETTLLNKLYELYGEELIDGSKRRINVLDNGHIDEYDGPIVLYVNYGDGYIATGWDYDDYDRITEDDKYYEFEYTYDEFLNQSTQDQLTESDDFDWASDVTPFDIGPLTVIWLDTEQTPELLEKLYHHMKKAKVQTRSPKPRPIELKDLVNLKGKVYLKLYKNESGLMLQSYGSTKDTFYEYEYVHVAEYLKGKPYKELYLSQML
jgi:hypothetical protein